MGELVRGFLKSQRGQRVKKQLDRNHWAPPNFQGLNCALHSWPNCLCPCVLTEGWPSSSREISQRPGRMLPISQTFPVGSRSYFIQLRKGVRAKTCLPSGAAMFSFGSGGIKWFWHIRRFESSWETKTTMGGKHGGLHTAWPGVCVKLPQRIGGSP